MDASGSASRAADEGAVAPGPNASFGSRPATLEPPADNPESGPGDAKVAGRAVEMPPPADNQIGGAGYFRLDITEVVLTYVGDPADHLVIETWHEGRGYARRTRK